MNVPAVVLSARPVPHPPLPTIEHVPAKPSRLGRVIVAEYARFQRVIAENFKLPVYEGFYDAQPVYGGFSKSRYSADFLRLLNNPMLGRGIDCKHGLTLEVCTMCVRSMRSGKGKQPPVKSHRFPTLVNGEVVGKKITRVINGSEDPSGYVWQIKNILREIRNGVVCAISSANDALEIGYSYKGRVELKFADALNLAEYAARHQNDEAATLLHLPHYCDGCLMHVTVLHDRVRCAAKMLTEQKHAAERIEMIREAWKQRRRAVLIAQGYWSSDQYDLDIIHARRGTVEAELITRFDRDLSRKGNKYRIR
jgi:hypothetical protein